MPDEITIPNLILLDTTLRDGELTPGVRITVAQKLQLAELLDAAGIDVIEVGYPGAYAKDVDAVQQVANRLQRATVCALAYTKRDEIISAGVAIQSARRGRIHLYTRVHLDADANPQQVLTYLKESITLAREYTDDVEWSAFDAPRSQPDFLYRAVETAIAAGATTINIPDSMGASDPDSFTRLLSSIQQHVPNIDQAILSVHCHNDRGLAVQNSIAAIHHGVRQVECAINGLGARKGNTDLKTLVTMLRQDQQVLQPVRQRYAVNLDWQLLDQASELVKQMTGIR